MPSRRDFLRFCVAAAGSVAVTSVTPAWGAVSTAIETTKAPVAERIYNLALRRAELAKIYEGHSWSINSAAEHIERMTELEMRELYRSSNILRRLQQRGYPKIEEIIELTEEKVFGRKAEPQKPDEQMQVLDTQDGFAYEALLHNGYQAGIKPVSRFPEPIFI